MTEPVLSLLISVLFIGVGAGMPVQTLVSTYHSINLFHKSPLAYPFKRYFKICLKGIFMR